MFGKYSEIWEEALQYQDKRNDEGHAEVVTKYTIKLSDLENANKDIAVPAAILHDIGWSQLNSKERMLIFDKTISKDKRLDVRYKHQDYGVKLAETILEVVHYPEQFAPKVLDIISEHDTREGYKTLEEAVMRDADKLWRVSKIGFYKDCEESNITARYYYQSLMNRISNEGLLFLESSKMLALNELEARKSEFEN